MLTMGLSQGEFEEWLFAQRKSLGGTAAGAIMGINRYMTAATLWEELVGLRPRGPYNEHMKRGNKLEPLAADEYREQWNREVWSVPKMYHPAKPWLHASPDRFIADEDEPTHGVLEIKCPAVYGFQQTKENGIDPSYYAQIQHYMNVAGVTWGAFAVFNSDLWELYAFDVMRDDAFIADMEMKMDRFWHENVLARQRPGPVEATSETVRTTSRRGAEYVVRTDTEFLSAMRALKAAHQAQKLADRQKALAVEKVKELLVEPQKVACHVGKVAWVETTTVSLDKEALMVAHPTIDLSIYERRKASTSFTPTFKE